MNGIAKNVALTGILGALGFLVMLVAIPWPLAGFLKIDLSEVIVLFGLFVGGPVVGVLVAILKSLLQFLIQGSTSGGVGEATAVIASLVYTLPIWLIYRGLAEKGALKALIMGCVVGTLSLAVVMVALNYFWITPFFARLNEMQFILDLMEEPKEFAKWIITVYGPFNLAKGAIVSVVYCFIHMRLKNSKLVAL